MQIEVAGKLKTADEPELADKFLAFIVSDAFQSIIPTTNWMYPAVTPSAGLPDGFDTLVSPAKSLLTPADQAVAVRDAALVEWQDALSK
jgi:thiamine transport system substrate-binding protein